MERWLRGKQRNNCWNKCFFFFLSPIAFSECLPCLYMSTKPPLSLLWVCERVHARAASSQPHFSACPVALQNVFAVRKITCTSQDAQVLASGFFFSFSLFSLEQRCLTKKTKQKNWICDLFDHSVSDFMQMNKRVMTNQISLTLYSCLVSILVHNKKIKAAICNFCTCWCLQGELQLWWWQTKPVYWNYIFYMSKGKGVGLISGSKNNFVCTI